jgi:para-nitrobenzyl esterase
LIAANEGPVGNFAYMDQIAALQWVKRNAAAFGGDAAQVTVVGESAGGDALMHLITSPEGRGLFHRAVVMSGDGRSHLIGGLPLTGGTTHKPSADQVGVNFAASVGIDGDGPDTLRALRALTAEQVRDDVNMLYLLNRLRPGAGPLTYANGTIVDGHIVLDSPGEMLQRGEAVRIPIMIGTTANDLPIRLPPLIDPLSYFGEEVPRARALYDPEATLTSPQLIFTVGADITMHEPARFVAQQMTASGSPAWLFRYDYVAESLRATTRHAAHASEIPFFFDTIDARYGSDVTAADRAAARLLSTYLVNFVKSGDPNGRGVPAWPRVDRSRPTLMLFTSDRGPVFGRDPWAERLDLVERAAQRRSTNESPQ